MLGRRKPSLSRLFWLPSYFLNSTFNTLIYKRLLLNDTKRLKLFEIERIYYYSRVEITKNANLIEFYVVKRFKLGSNGAFKWFYNAQLEKTKLKQN